MELKSKKPGSLLGVQARWRYFPTQKLGLFRIHAELWADFSGSLVFLVHKQD